MGAVSIPDSEMFLDLIPDDPLIALAWRDCLLWAIRQDDILERYRAETGDNYRPGTSVLEQMVDQATGRDKAFAESFVRWFNANVWGEV